MWSQSNEFDRYAMIGGATGIVVGVSVGVECVRHGRPASEAAVTGVMTGSASFVFWPLLVACGVLYIPLKVLETLTL